ncbi:MAG: DUF479 domain-containing protein [Burkholderiales bacterium]|nr:DUF479 domain-containing protein [Burkholderiales bacterium]
MNYLAHILLARQSDAAMVGALLGDFVKANGGDAYPAEMAFEITLHRQIDRYTDEHPVVRAAWREFDPARRRYAGILLDVLYDHLLTQRWDQYCDTPRDAFIRRFYQALRAHHALLPDTLRQIAPLMIDEDWLGRYHDFAGVEWAIARISRRLSRNGHLLRDGLADLHTHYAAFAEGFDAFFPELIAFVQDRRAQVGQPPEA